MEQGIRGTGRTLRRSCGLLLAVLIMSMTAGCLSLGGKTTYVGNNQETEARIAALENRINALEGRH